MKPVYGRLWLLLEMTPGKCGADDVHLKRFREIDGNLRMSDNLHPLF